MKRERPGNEVVLVRQGFHRFRVFSPDPLQVDKASKPTLASPQIRRRVACEFGGCAMSATRATAFFGEGHLGLKRLDEIKGDPYAFMDHTPIEIEPLNDGRTKRFINPEKQSFLDEIRRDVASGKLNPKKILSSGRQKSS
jgi:hypothetical protein